MADESRRCIVVVPCFNEADRLDRRAFHQFAEAHDCEFLFVDDGSADSTLAVLDEMAHSSARLSVLSLATNQGKGEAVRRGLREASSRGPRYVGYWDADLATPLEEIIKFRRILDEEDEVDFVLGSRIRLLGRTIERNPARHYFGRVAATAVSLMLALPVYDTQCGAKLFRVGPRLDQVLQEPFVTRWVFDVEIIARWLIALGSDRDQAERRIVEVPLNTWRDIQGSKLGSRDFARAPAELIKIWTVYGRSLRQP